MSGTVRWIGVRPERKAEVQVQSEVYADQSSGLTGDHDTQPHRQVTLVSQESLAQVATALGIDVVDPARTRRNILISGISFDLHPGKRIRVGQALLEITGPCLPCSRMDETLGDGGRTAMADAGGLTARILESGNISTGDTVEILA